MNSIKQLPYRIVALFILGLFAIAFYSWFSEQKYGRGLRKESLRMKSSEVIDTKNNSVPHEELILHEFESQPFAGNQQSPIVMQPQHSEEIEFHENKTDPVRAEDAVGPLVNMQPLPRNSSNKDGISSAMFISGEVVRADNNTMLKVWHVLKGLEAFNMGQPFRSVASLRVSLKRVNKEPEARLFCVGISDFIIVQPSRITLGTSQESSSVDAKAFIEGSTSAECLPGLSIVDGNRPGSNPPERVICIAHIYERKFAYIPYDVGDGHIRPAFSQTGYNITFSPIIYADEQLGVLVCDISKNSMVGLFKFPRECRTAPYFCLNQKEGILAIVGSDQSYITLVDLLSKQNSEENK